MSQAGWSLLRVEPRAALAPQPGTRATTPARGADRRTSMRMVRSSTTAWEAICGGRGEGRDTVATVALVQQFVKVRVSHAMHHGEAPRDAQQEAPGTGETEAGAKARKRKVAVFLGYVGAGYAGMQRNPGVQAIEDVLELAMHKAGGISQANLGDLSKLSWSRAARTDKGVSAVGQVVGVKLVVDPPGVVERINAALPANFRCFGVTRTTNGFSAKNMCDRRRYRYILPEWALLPPGSCGGGHVCAAPPELPAVPPNASLESLNRVLAQFVGTYSFHNFTPRARFGDGNVKRYILSFQALPDVCVVNDRRMIILEVVGQSFLLNQIRKMVGAALGVHRGALPPDQINTALQSPGYVAAPLAPELGLYLAESLFGAYNKRWADSHELLDLNTFGPQVAEFEREHVMRHIVDTDARTGVFRSFVALLHDDRRRALVEAEDEPAGPGAEGAPIDDCGGDDDGNDCGDGDGDDAAPPAAAPHKPKVQVPRLHADGPAAEEGNAKRQKVVWKRRDQPAVPTEPS